MTISDKYNPQEIEKNIYDYWLTNGYLYSTPDDDRTPYTIVMPPPNVTGVLHMGHMLNNTIQDVLIRKARLKGYNACWVPGTDHASIATEAKVVDKLKKEGIDKQSLTREEFLEHAWQWTHKHGNIILEQLKRLGCSCDWQRAKFTMDKDLSDSVIKTFVDLYNEGLIYKGYRMINWDPQAQTTLSDEEVIHIERKGILYYIKYQLEHSQEEYIVVATTRPETIFGDTAICVNPKDERYTHLIGKQVVVPICNRSIKVIADEYVNMEFGTACLKITPSHDTNDQKIGEKHNLKFINILERDGTLNKEALHYQGKDRFEARKLIIEELRNTQALVKEEPHINKIGTSERTGAVIEPLISEQWFLKMKDISKKALDSVLNQEVQLVPKKFINTYKHWIDNIHDWNISRQLWWGHQIPVYYYNTKGDYVVANSKKEALSLAQKKDSNIKLNDLRQEEYVLDTWFSSCLWPISVFNGILEPNNKDIKYYYPTNDLVTAPEILFFWVARMIIAGYHIKNDKPFKNVYLTGIVRDKQRRKMSKSLGNSPDPIDLINKYGADGVRVGMLLCSPAGNDLIFDEDLCKQGSNFGNKIWNAFKLIKGWEIAEDISQPLVASYAIKWFEHKFNKTLAQIENNYEKYRISDALMEVYKLVWDDFCSWLLEMVKPAYKTPIDTKTHQKVVSLFENVLKLLHPFMPFISEEIWQHLSQRTKEEALIISSFPHFNEYDEVFLEEFSYNQELIATIRTIRKEKNIPFREAISLLHTEKKEMKFVEVLQKMVNISKVSVVTKKEDNCIDFMVRTDKYFIPYQEASAVYSDKEINKLKQQLAYTEGFLKSVEGKLNNKKFVSNAPEKVISMEKKKQADAITKIEILKKTLGV